MTSHVALVQLVSLLVSKESVNELYPEEDCGDVIEVDCKPGAGDAESLLTELSHIIAGLEILSAFWQINEVTDDDAASSHTCFDFLCILAADSLRAFRQLVVPSLKR